MHMRTAHLQRVLSTDGYDLILVVAQLTGPRASLTDPLDEAGLVGAPDRPAASARAQELPLWDRDRQCTQSGPRASNINKLILICILWEDVSVSF